MICVNLIKRSQKSKCTKCGKSKHVWEFKPEPRNTRKKISSHCRKCISNASIKRLKWAKAAGKDLDRKYKLKLFGLTEFDYASILAAQAGVCAVCRKPPTKRRLAVDHDHQTGLVRGLLCGTCNTGLGCLKDDIDIIFSLLEYLNAHLSACPPQSEQIISPRSPRLVAIP